MNSPEDFVWRFRLEPPPPATANPDPLVEMLRAFLEDLLQIGFLTSGGERVRVDGFALSNEPRTVHPIFPDPADLSSSSGCPVESSPEGAALTEGGGS